MKFKDIIDNADNMSFPCIDKLLVKVLAYLHFANDPVSLVVKKGRLRWFVHLECKDDADWIKCCTLMEVGGIRQRRTP